MTDRADLFNRLQGCVRDTVNGSLDRDEKLKIICTMLRDGVEHYDWVGFYVADADKEELVLGPFAGEPTEHVRIPFGRGICGQAAAASKTVVAQDVTDEDNYLSCSPRVQSEIAVPILKHERFVGELDIDSHTISPFTEEDVRFLEEVCRMVSELF
ncbi:hypothetical protein AMJ39_02630 [candidate division TA06 bacterium DG_24]|uniref:GAF domain-containing protein n=2 Tax=Bacteria division TA06 TaxID=1156500 RepID=A0A0S8GE95_UNCT6|nr:MAG: hypothetical protein AMJ39_02630 [candidate division TA06 bacterium DG_24]KPK71349.1 MAG: hypothetical protein AMJ82_01120 [candidate division TA06 bacterium SM23_40]